MELREYDETFRLGGHRNALLLIFEMAEALWVLQSMLACSTALDFTLQLSNSPSTKTCMKIEKGKNTLRKMKEMGSLLSKLVRTWVWIGKSSQWPFQSGQILPH